MRTKEPRTKNRRTNEPQNKQTNSQEPINCGTAEPRTKITLSLAEGNRRTAEQTLYGRSICSRNFIFPGINVIASVLHSFVRSILFLRFWLFQRQRHGRLVLEHMLGMDLVVPASVFNPALFFSSALLARAAAVQPIVTGTQVLDLGCGTGIQGLLAAQRGAHVVAIDLNAEAIRAVQINALLNQLPVEVVQGDLFGPVNGRRFDLVLWNPPYLPRNQGSVGTPSIASVQSPRVSNQGLAMAFYTQDGMAQRFANALPEHVSAQGYALVVLSTSGDQQAFLNAFRAAGLKCVAVMRRNILSEVLTVYRVHV